MDTNTQIHRMPMAHFRGVANCLLQTSFFSWAFSGPLVEMGKPIN